MRIQVQRVLGNTIGPDGRKTKVMEMSGKGICTGLGPRVEDKPYPYTEVEGACLVQSDKCLRRKVCYIIICQVCEEIIVDEMNENNKETEDNEDKTKYIGTTGCTAHCRSGEHQNNFCSRT